MRRFLALALALVLGCAQASVSTGGDGSPTTDGGRGDAVGQGDAPFGDGRAPADARDVDGPRPDAGSDVGTQTDGQKDSAPQADAQKDTAPQQDTAPQCNTQNLLVNGNLEQGPTGGWQRYSSWGLDADPVIYGCGALAHGCQGGSYAAWFGGADAQQNQLYQTVTVPTGTTSLRLTGYRWIDTEETDGPWDGLWIELYSGQNLLEGLATYSDRDATSAWTAFALPAASTHAGQAITLLLDAVTDDINVTSFYLDTLALEAVVCQ